MESDSFKWTALWLWKCFSGFRESTEEWSLMKAQHLCTIFFSISTFPPSRELTGSKDLTEGKTSWCLLRLELQLCDFASPLLSDVWCQTSHEAHPAFSHWECYQLSSLIAEYLPLGILKELNILQLLWLYQIRLKSANRFRCHGQSLRHTGIEENPSKTDILSFYTWNICLQNNLLSEMQPQGRFPVNSAEPGFHPITNPSPFHNKFTLLSCSAPFPFWSLHCH